MTNFNNEITVVFVKDCNIENERRGHDVAEEIRSLMGRQGIDFPELAERAGLTQSTVYRKIKHEESPLNIVQIEKCASALGVSMTDLMRMAEENKVVA